MPIPPMVPSAKERVDVRITNVSGPTIVVHRSAAQELVEAAFRDGYAANDRAERMLAVLPAILRVMYGDDARIDRVIAAIKSTPKESAVAASIATETQAQEPGR